MQTDILLPPGRMTRAANARVLMFWSVAILLMAATSRPAVAQAYAVNNIISDGSVPATTMDPNFINPWGISSSPTWWISAQGSGFNYVVASAGTISFKVIVPAASGLTTSTGLPAGSVTTAGATGMLLPNGTKASFLFSTLDGTISGWNSKLGTANAISQIAINNSAAGASYPGLAILTTSTNSYLLAANFGTANAIEVYDNTFKLAKLTGSFTDPSLPANYAPFSVHVLGSQVFVNYALRSSTAPFRSVNGSGNGIVSVFDTSGNFVARAITGGNLNAPWGIAFAPANFGVFSNALLVGNFGDGIINAYDPKTYAYLGQLMDAKGQTLGYANLWELLTGGTAVAGTTSVSGGDTSTVYFTAGLTNEAHGLFAGITSSTTAGSTPAFGFSASSGAATVSAGASTQATLSVAPVNGFSGSVSLTCSGLPAGATCNFSPAQVTVSPSACSFSTLTIGTTKASASLRPMRSPGATMAGISSALLLPFASLLAFRRPRSGRRGAPSLRLLGLGAAFLLASTLFLGCADNGQTPVTATPAGQSKVVITATSGSTSQSTSIGLTVQ